MEKAVLIERSDKGNMWFSVAAVGVVILMGIVVYGLDFAAPGAHDTFHDFRHSIGITCH